MTTKTPEMPRYCEGRTTGRRGVKLDCKFGPFFPAQINLVGEQLQTFNKRDLMTLNAILFHSGDDPFTPGGLGVFFESEAFRTRHEVPRKNSVSRSCRI